MSVNIINYSSAIIFVNILTCGKYKKEGLNVDKELIEQLKIMNQNYNTLVTNQTIIYLKLSEIENTKNKYIFQESQKNST
jgi:hypothetical protein